jgi:hypothetical protein
MDRDRIGVIGTGLGLIGLGIAFIVAQLVGWDKIWPVFPLVGGLAFWAGYVASGFRDAGFVFVGTAAVLLGLFFFGFTFGIWGWEQMSALWPVFALIGGVAFIVLFFAERARDVGVLGVGLAAVIVGVVGLAVTHDLLGESIVKLWPLLFILVGLFGLASGFLRILRRE